MRRLLLTALATVGLLWPSLPAQAALSSEPDSARDVTVWTDTSCDSEDGTLPEACGYSAPSAASGDFLRTNVRHMRSSVQVRAKVRLVDVVGQRSYVVRYVTNEGLRRTLRVTAKPGVLQPASVVFRKASGDQVSCPGLTASYDSAYDLVTLTAPRSCLSSPSWVRVSVTSEGRWIACPSELLEYGDEFCASETGRRVLRTGYVAADEAYGTFSNTLSGFFGPRVYRG